MGKMWQLFGEEIEEIINELNEELAAWWIWTADYKWLYD
jgi:hypothetical protein